MHEQCADCSPATYLPCPPLQLRRDIPESVVASQALLDEQLPQVQSALSGAKSLLEKAQAAVAAHDAQLPGKQAELHAVAERLVIAQDQAFVLAAEAQRERHELEREQGLRGH